MAALRKWIGSTLNNSSEDVDGQVVKEKNAQISDEVFVDGVQIFQDGNGAPVEQVSPLGYHIGTFSILFLNVSEMVGTGVFSTREFLHAMKLSDVRKH